MKTSKRNASEFLNGVPELLILQLLAERSMHGYELVQSIRLRSGEALEFGEGCIYPILHRLEREGHLSSERIQVNGRPRVVYRATRDGVRRLADSATCWERVVSAVRLVMEGGPRGQTIHA